MTIETNTPHTTSATEGFCLNRTRQYYKAENGTAAVGLILPKVLIDDLKAIAKHTLGHERVSTMLKQWVYEMMEQKNYITKDVPVQMSLSDIERAFGRKITLVDEVCDPV